MDYQAFVDKKKTLLIAPAGYGKTYTIAECLKYTAGRQLILTHTHAGVASIKEKIKHSGISSNQYHVETLSSFAQKYANAFYTRADTPDQENSKEYHPFIIAKATLLFKSNIIKNILKATYTGLFVDEYQDCTKLQHQMVLALSESLQTRILGDPLQGIFDFNGDLVDFDTDLSGFERVPDLSTPYRWYQDGNNSSLGDRLKEIRELLLQGKDINLSSDNTQGLYTLIVNINDINDSKSKYRRSLDKLITNPENNPDFDSLLIIVPEYSEDKGNGQKIPKGNINDRAQIRAKIDYGKTLALLEAIDDKSFYLLAKKIDSLNSTIGRVQKPIKKIKESVLENIFNKTELDKWFTENGIKDKRAATDKIKANKLQTATNLFVANPSPQNISDLISEIRNTLKLKYKRDGLLYAILKALKQAALEEITVYEAMKNQRNIIRRSGQKIIGKCIGTTLLTKGLEFDTVAILDADKINSPKNLYVALTRCCKNLIIFSSQDTLSPYDN